MKARRLKAVDGTAMLRRAHGGVPEVTADTWLDAYFALGWLHGRDRGAQVCLMRMAGQGRLCELLRDDDSVLDVDRRFRRLGLARDAESAIDHLGQPHADYLAAYCRGMNAAWSRRTPWMLRLAGYRPEPYRPADMLLIVKLMSFAGLAEAQREVELFIIHAVRRGVDAARLHCLFPDLDTLDSELVTSLVEAPPLASGARLGGTPRIAGGSNAWVVAGSRTRSGLPILCNDPHLEVNRLPAVLYEATLRVEDRWVKGATVPGLAGFLVGRTPDVAWGVTYSCADTCDFFVERCRDGRYLRDGRWLPLRRREETILRARHPPVKLMCYENDEGILETDGSRDGDHLSWRWCGFGHGGLGTLRAFADLNHCSAVPAAQEAARAMDIPTFHMVLADRAGRIGYQLTGAVPRRAALRSGLAPLPAWVADNHWQGTLDPETQVPQVVDPPEGYIVSANEARRHPSGPLLINLPLAPYRRLRIEQRLQLQPELTVQDMQALQYDVHSLEAENLLPLYLPHVPAGAPRTLLEDWDHRYTADSRAATVFENIHRAVIIEVFGCSLGREWLGQLLESTSLYLPLAGFFDAVLRMEDSPWLPAAMRDTVLAQGVRVGLGEPVQPWGERNTVVFENLFLGGRLPRFLGFDRGPYPLAGNHGTVSQGSRMRVGGRLTSTAPSYRFITDLGNTEVCSNLPGGPSESRFSRGYASDLKSWLTGRYKRL